MWIKCLEVFYVIVFNEIQWSDINMYFMCVICENSVKTTFVVFAADRQKQKRQISTK